jgi:Uma2 family endonuclease
VKRGGKALGEGVTNPTVIVEVLSSSTERYDREEKFGHYRHLSSLKEYVLVSQDEPLIEVFRRPADAHEARTRWPGESGRPGETVTIHGAAIEVADVYGTADPS